jgi:hypothetical protein
MKRMSDQTPPDSPTPQEAEFLDRLRREELRVVDLSALADNPFERKATWRSAFRGSGTRAWVAGALAVAVLMLAWQLRPQGSSEDTVRTSPDGIARLTAANPRSLRQQIVAELHAAGVQAAGYEQLGITGIDADLPQPTPPEVLAILQKHRIPAPPNGALRIEITQP